jgi:hypothetical protein
VCFTIHILLSAPDAVKKHSGECVNKFGGAATMVEWPRTVNPVLKKRNRFESYHLHQIYASVAERSNAVDCKSIVRGFESLPMLQIWSQSVHGRTRHCHCRRRGSLPLGTAKFCRYWMERSPCIERLILVSLGGSNPLVCTKF